MNLDETSRVLAKAAAFDQRTIGESDVRAWHEALSDLDATDAMAAVTRHYRDSRDRLWPADVRRLADEIDRDRRRAARERAELEASQREALERPPVGRSEATAALVQAVVDALPKSDVHERALKRARADRGRPEPATRQPKPKRKPPKDYPAPSSDDIAVLATRYLLDGHEPRDVAERLAVSRRWCEKTIRRLRPATEGASS